MRTHLYLHTYMQPHTPALACKASVRRSHRFTKARDVLTEILRLMDSKTENISLQETASIVFFFDLMNSRNRWSVLGIHVKSSEGIKSRYRVWKVGKQLILRQIVFCSVLLWKKPNAKLCCLNGVYRSRIWGSIPRASNFWRPQFWCTPSVEYDKTETLESTLHQ